MNSLNSIINTPECEPKQCEPYVDTLIGNIQRKQKRAQLEVDNTTAALKALQDNPQIANVLELILKTGR